MKRDLSALARAFLAAAGAPPCLSEAAVVTGLAAVFAEDARRAATPYQSTLRNRRVDNLASPVFARALAEFGFTREQLASDDSRDHWLVHARDAVCAWLRAAKLSISAIAALVNRDRVRVRAAIARHEARATAGRTVARWAAAEMAPEARRVAHG